MRVIPKNPLELGQRFRDFAMSFTQANRELKLGHDLGKEIERTFHSLDPANQRDLFVAPLWDLVDEHLQTISHIPKTSPVKIPGKTYPIVPGIKEGLDFIPKINTNTGEVTEISLSKGGLASNVVETFALFDTPAFIPSLHGNSDNRLAKIHRMLMESAGIDTSQLVHTKANSYLHTCFYIIDGHEKDYWMTQARDQFHIDELDQFTGLIKQSCEENKGEVLVLSALPPAGTGDDYFPELVDIANLNGNPVFFNPKQYDYLNFEKGRFLTHLLIQKGLTLIKPNLDEFVQLLRYSHLINKNDQAGLLDELKKDASKQRFDTLIKKGQELLQYLNENGILLISVGEHGAVIINKKYAIYSKAPKIDSINGCPSGAGDSGLAMLIMETRNRKIDFQKTLDDTQLTPLLDVFIKEATATASLPGTLIAGKEEFAASKEKHLWTHATRFKY